MNMENNVYTEYLGISLIALWVRIQIMNLQMGVKVK